MANLQLAVIYDYTVQWKEDPLVKDTETMLRYFAMILEPGAFLVDTLPFRESFCTMVQFRMLTLHSETSAGVVPGCRLQKNREGMARTERQYVPSAP